MIDLCLKLAAELKGARPLDRVLCPALANNLADGGVTKGRFIFSLLLVALDSEAGSRLLLNDKVRRHLSVAVKWDLAVPNFPQDEAERVNIHRWHQVL